MPTDPRIDYRDPPVFLIQANPTWAPGLADGSWQRVPIGTTGQVITVNADGSVGWSNAAGGFSNPMTTTGDMIFSNPGATPVRLPIGVGAQVLTVSGGVPTWQNAASGFANPMNALGDMITAAGGGSPIKIPIGSAGQVLTVVGTVPVWSTAPGGFTNPMTNIGDIIIGSTAGAAIRLGAGSNGQVLSISSGSPAWTSGPAGAYAVVFPSGDTTGVTDQANITATWTSGSLQNGGVLQLAPGKFYVKPTSGLNCLTPPAQTNTSPNNGGSPVSIIGSGMATVLYPVGAGVTGIYYHRTNTYGAQYNNPAQQAVGYLRDFVIDGTNTSGAATGLDIGDGWGDSGGIHLRVVNFDTAGAIGVNFINRLFWSEKWRFWLDLSNNTTAMLMTTNVPGSDHSHEYNYFDIVMFCNQNQQGIIVDGVNMGGSSLFLKGNMCQTTATVLPPTGNTAMLTIRNTTGQNNSESRWYFGQIWTKVEFNQTAQFGSGTIPPYGIFMDGTARGIQECSGFISHSLSNSNINNSEFSFSGPIAGDTNLATAFTGAPGSQNTVNPGNQPAFPGLGTIQQNYGPDSTVCVSGGTVTGISINGQATGLTSGAFNVRAGGSITVNGSVAPANYTWVPAAQMSF